MGVISAAARELIAAGVTGDALVTALERIEAAGSPVQPVEAEPPDSLEPAVVEETDDTIPVTSALLSTRMLRRRAS